MANDYLYGVRTRRVASAGLDGLTPLLLLAYVLGVVGGGVYMHVQLSSLIEQGRVDPSVSPAVMWTGLIVGIVMLFAITGPMVLLGVFVASKIMKFPLSGAAYLKACGVAALPALMIMLANVLPQNVALRLLVVIAIIPVVFFVIANIFELKLAEAAVTLVLSGVTGVMGLVISGLIVAAVLAGGIFSNKVAAQQAGKQGAGGLGPLPGLTSPSTPMPSNAETSHRGSRESAADALRDRLAALAAQTPTTSREAQQRDVAALKAQAEQAGAAREADVMNLLQELEQRAAAAPSEQPEPELFEPPHPVQAWEPAEAQRDLLALDEVSFQSLNLRLPRNFRADLDASESETKGISFSSGRPDSGKLVLRTVPVTNPKQQRPWVTRQAFQSAAAQRKKLFTVDGAGAATVNEGSMNGITFTRVLHEPGKRWGVPGRSAQYVARVGDVWLIADAVAPSATPAALEVLEAAVRTIRPRPPGDPMHDPMSASALAARLAEDPDRVGQLLRLKGKEAEEAIVPQLKSADARVARAAAAVLGEVGTEKSIPALQDAARSSDTFLAGAAREAIKQINPQTLDVVAEALIDLEGTDTHRKRAALDKLAQNPPAADDARREKVATIVEAQILGPDAFFIAERAGPALVAWSGGQTVPRLAAALNNENAPMPQRRAIIGVLAKLKDERGVFPVVRWIIKDTDIVTAALIEMGPVAEPEMIKLLKERDPSVRTAAARVLQEIGTAKSLSTLKRASQDPRDPGAAAAARVALDIVTERAKTSNARSGATPRDAD